MDQYLNKCIDSIIGNTNHNFELILVDDGSTDASANICDGFAQRDERIRVFHQPNRGVSSARNLGIENAAGDYVWFIDPDDWIADDAIDVLERTILQEQPDLLVFSHLKFLEKDKTFKQTLSPLTINKTTVAYYLNQTGYLRPNVWCYLYKATLFANGTARFPAQPYFEDEIFNLEILGKAQSIMQIPNKLYFYRERENSAMTKPFSEEKLFSYLSLLRCYKHFLQNEFATDFVWVNVFSYINNVKAGLEQLDYSRPARKKIVFEMKSKFRRIPFLKKEARGILLYKFLYNYFPSLYATI